ncbi:hypothetical protein BDZ45DRAFT_675693 [Acephala macrosclerotiorum]|nr:hypothetical protein BDZ45DRAFT_675693 [Acephala macrosclerotiorum]
MACHSKIESVQGCESRRITLSHNALPPTLNPSVKYFPMQMTGVRCPTCASNGQEVWVIPGRTCAYCGTHC